MNKPIGLAYRKLDAAQEHISHAWYNLCKEFGYSDKAQEYPNTKGLKPGTTIYHAAAVFEYSRSAWEVLKDHVPNDWQLCPYQDCHWGCGIDKEGIYICSHCNRYFHAEYSDSDYEDMKLTKYETEKNELIAGVELAYDFGPTWASND